MVPMEFDIGTPRPRRSGDRDRRLRRLPHRPRLLSTTACAPSTRCRSRSATRSAAASSPPARRRALVQRPRGDRAGGDPLRRMRCLCKRGKRDHLPRTRKCRATTSRAASPPTSSCPRAGCASVDEHRLAAAGIDLAEVSVDRRCGDHALSGGRAAPASPQAISSSSIGVGGVGGYCVQIAAAFGAHSRRDRRRATTSSPRSRSTAPRSRSIAQDSMTPRDIKAAIQEFAKEQRPARRPSGSFSNVPARAAGQQTAFGLLVHGATLARGRLHHGQGRDAAVEPDGLSTRARSATGAARPSFIRPRWNWCSTAASRSSRSSRSTRSPTSTTCSRRSTPARIKRRAVLVPVTSIGASCHDRSRSQRRRTSREGSRSGRRRRSAQRQQGRALREAPGAEARRQAGAPGCTTPGSRSTTRASSIPTPPTW